MLHLTWERLLETCYHRQAGVAMLVPGSPPVIRIGDTFRSLRLPPLEASELEAFVKDRLSETPNVNSEDGYAYGDFEYDNRMTYRVMAFAFPKTRALVVNIFNPKRPPPDKSGDSEAIYN
jgi:hypothetical protein